MQLKSQHEDLLHQQLAQVRRAYIQQFGVQHQTAITTSERSADSSTSSSVPSNIVFVQSPGGTNIRLVETETSTTQPSEEASTGTIVIMKSEEAENKSDDDEDETVTETVGSSKLVINTRSRSDSDKDATIIEEEEVVSETVLEPMESETVVQVTLPAASNTVAVDKDNGAKPTVQNQSSKEVESSPRSKRRKKSH